MFEKLSPQDPITPHIHLPSPEESVITGRPKVLASQIIENLRVALDYAVFALSKKNCPTLNEHDPKFVIVDNKVDFGRAAKKGLRYLTNDERKFIELLQPYRAKPGTLSVTALIRDAANVSKHRNLLSIRQQANVVHIIRADRKDEHKYGEEWWRFPAQDGSIFFVKVSDLRVLLFGRYNYFGFVVDHQGEHQATEKQEKNQRSVGLYPGLDKYVVEFCEKERRSMTQMCEMLIEEAVQRRHEVAVEGGEEP